MGVNIRAKGQRGEREAIDVIEGWALPITEALGLPPVSLERNLQQSRAGGYDVIGLDWLALEVKRHENLQVSTWWKQTLRQAGDTQVPFLMYRPSRTPWKFRVRLTTAHYGPEVSTSLNGLTVDMDADNCCTWFQYELYARLKGTTL